MGLLKLFDTFDPRSVGSAVGPESSAGGGSLSTTITSSSVPTSSSDSGVSMENSDSGLSTGEIAGIVVGSVCGVIIVLAIAFALIKHGLGDIHVTCCKLC